MSKNILTETIININNVEELIDLFLYDKIAQIKKEISEQEILIFFDRYFKTTIPQQRLHRFARELKIKLDLILAESKRNLQRKGYEVINVD